MWGRIRSLRPFSLPLWLLTVAIYAQSAPPPELQSLIRQGAEAMHNNDAPRAEQLFERATQAAPEFAPGWLDLGLVQLKQNKLEQAIRSLHRSLALDPAAAGAHLFLGIAEYQASHADEAVQSLQAAIEQDPHDVRALTWLGIVELNSGHPEKAAQPLDRAAELSPKDENVLDYRVQAHMAVAKQSYGELVKVDPTSWRLHRLNAVVYAQARDHKRAIDEYRQAIHLAPEQPSLYEGLGWEYRALGEAEPAMDAFRHQLQLTPGNPIAMFNLCSSQVEGGQVQAATPMLEKVVKIYNQPTAADYYLGRALAAQARYAEAAKEFERAATLNGELKQRSYYQLAQMYRHLGKTEQAQQAVDRYKQLRQASDSENAREIEDWHKLNAANEPAPAALDPR